MINKKPKIGRIRAAAGAFIFITVAALAPAAIARAAAVETIPVSELKAGMKGYGLTVFRGLEPSKFPVVVKGVLPKSGMAGEDMILVELTGPEVEKYGGISLGMSGSPVYIDDRLIGAVSFTFPMTDHDLGGVTPIESMLRVHDYEAERSGSVPLPVPIEYDGKIYHTVRFGDGGEPAPGELVAAPALAPVAVRGISSRTLPILRSFFAESGVEIRPVLDIGAGSAGGEKIIGKGAELEPGGSVAVQLVRGDLDVSAVGTLTMIDGDLALMFGHPFFRKGPVDYLLADAYVHAVVRGDEAPFKLASTGLLRGRVIEDRGTALLGRLDSFPMLVPLKVSIIDKDLGRADSYSYKIVRDSELIVHLIATAVLHSLDKSVDRLGNGTAAVSFTVRHEGGSPITRENMFYDSFDISARSIMELVSALGLLQSNRFVEAPVTGVELTVEIDSSNSIASIEKAEIAGGATGEVNVESEAGVPIEFGEEDEEETEDDEEEIKHEENEPDETDTGGDDSDEYSEESDEESEGRDWQSILRESLAKGDEEKKKIPIVHPGDKLDVRVSLRPYRKEPVEENIFIKVPRDIAAGRAVISVFSGNEGFIPASPADLMLDIKVETPEKPEDSGPGIGEPEDGQENFEELIREFVEKDRNNELIATIESLSFDTRTDEEKEELEEEMEEDEEDKGKEHKAKKRTGWVLQGSASIKVKVEEKVGFKDRPITKSKINTLRDK